METLSAVSSDMVGTDNRWRAGKHTIRAMPDRHADRPLDIVLWGATGYTGHLVAEHLASHAAKERRPIRWALAGRDRPRLETVRSGLARLSPACAELPIVTADAGDPASLEALARQTRVVCTTVGPYARYGSGLVGACARLGTHYCDLTGEVPWMRQMIDRHHHEAMVSGARIVHGCGFDSIPSDLGVLMLVEHLRTRHGRATGRVDAFFGMKGGPSGGTVASMLDMIDQAAKDSSVRRLLGNPYALDPSPERRGPDKRDSVRVGYEHRLDQWTGPFLMAGINTRVVRRSNTLLGERYGAGFRYTERASYGKGVRGMATAVGFTGGLGAFVAALQVPWLRPQVERLIPAPGQGPTAAEREAGYFKVRLFGESDPAGVRAEATVSDHFDPGYGSTSRMLGQAALSLACDDDALPRMAGVLTPATALGMPLVERLRRVGLTFSVEDAA
jgi:short subunit dehydrogenase-like uncharacterized protein